MNRVSTQLADLFEMFEPQSSLVPLSLVQQTAFRLDAGSYVADSINSLMSVVMRHDTEKLGDMSKVFRPAIFKRTYIAAHGDAGIPLLTSAEIMEHSPKPSVIAKASTPKWEQYQVDRGYLLVSCSGTIGNVSVVPQYWSGWAASEHSIRIVPSSENQGLIWAFITLPSAKDLMVGRKSGSVINHIYEADVADIDVPVVSDSTRDELNLLFDRMLIQREMSQEHHTEAVLDVLKCCGLPELDHDGEGTEAEISKEFSRAIFESGSYRLDAHFYNPTSRRAVANIRMCREVKTVGDVAEVVFTGGRMKRNYVESDHGVPFLSGKNIVQIRPSDLKYLSNLQIADMPGLLLKRANTLITRSGTIGRTCFVWKNFENYAGSEHIFRVIPDDSKIDPGYLYAFLSSQYGYEQILRYRHGSVIDEVTDKQIEQVLIPLPSRSEQTAIGDKVREAYEKRAEAIRLEDEAQAILMKEITRAPGAKGV